MKKSKTKQSKLTKDDLVRDMAFQFLGASAFIITHKQLESFCNDYVNWRMKNNGTGHFKADGTTYKDDLQGIIDKYKYECYRKELFEIIGENATTLSNAEIENITKEVSTRITDGGEENLERDLQHIYDKYRK